MKKILVLIVAIALFATGGYLCTVKNTPSENYYPMVDRAADVVVCEDGAGNLWEFTECDDWQMGDFVSLLMNTNNTPQTIYDDTIEMVRYAGLICGD